MDLDDLPEPAFEGTVPVEEVDVDGENPNEQSDEMFGLLCSNMRQKGWIGNAIVTDTDGLIADGEHRWRAAKEIGLEEVPVKQYEIDDADRRLWRQELNKISGDHDPKRDALEYDYLLSEGKSDAVRDLTEATDEDLDDLLAQIKVDRKKHVPYEYEVDHTVYFEDCIQGIRERLADDSVDCVVTDPPYGIDYSGGQTEYGEEKFNRLQADEDLDGAIQLYREMCAEAKRVLKPDGHFYAFTRWDVYPAFLATTTEFFDIRNCLVWVKNNHGLGDLSGQYAPKHEFAIFAGAEDARPLQDGRPTDVLEYAKPNTSEYDHPTEKPLDLIVDLLTNSTQEGDTVLDPFMGSGTTAVAAIQNDRDYVGFEVDEENYRPVVERRIGEAIRTVESETNQQTTDAAGDD